MRVGVFGWGVVAPKSPNIETFRKNLESAESWLTPFNGFGPDTFLVGTPEFRFEDYKPWVDRRFAPRHFQNLKEKMGTPARYAIGAFIQALGQNPGIEEDLRALGQAAQVYVGTGVGALDTIYDASIRLYETQKRWDEFWAQPERNRMLRGHLNGDPVEGAPAPGGPDWNRFWMERSPELHEYLGEMVGIEGMAIEGEVESGKLNSLREKEKRRVRLQQKWQAPEPPWKVSANVIWNIHNSPAAQISILAKITGLAFAPVAACSTFGVALRLGMRAIQTGDAKLVVVGATDPPPHPLTVGAFYSARVLAADKKVSAPFSQLKGTHIAGGSAVWIIGDMDYCLARGYRPLGMEPIAVGVSSDADHIITPSAAGPRAAMTQALAESRVDAPSVRTWDVHATATPGDFSEISTLRGMFDDAVLVTARKGTFGHGMSAGGGWELTAQYLGHEAGRLFATPLTAGELNHAVAGIHNRFVFDQACEFPAGLAGKMSMGIGGINACVISRPLKTGD